MAKSKSNPLKFLFDVKFRVFLVAVLFGLAAAYLVNVYVQRTVYQETGGPEVPIVVARQTLNPGELITDQNIGVRSAPADWVSARSIRATDAHVLPGTRVAHKLLPGESVLWSDIDLESRLTLADAVDLNNRAMTLNVSAGNSFDNMIQPGDRVDIIHSRRSGRLRGTGSIEMLLQNVFVLAVNEDTVRRTLLPAHAGGASGSSHSRLQAVKPQQTSVNSVTIRVSPEDAMRIALAESEGRLTFLLRNPGDIFTFDWPVLESKDPATAAPTTTASATGTPQLAPREANVGRPVPGFPTIMEEGRPVRSAFYPSSLRMQHEMADMDEPDFMRQQTGALIPSAAGTDDTSATATGDAAASP